MPLKLRHSKRADWKHKAIKARPPSLHMFSSQQKGPYPLRNLYLNRNELSRATQSRFFLGKCKKQLRNRHTILERNGVH